MTQSPWSVKGIDPKARSVARERAQRQGVTLGQYLNSLLLEGDEGVFEDIALAPAGLPRADDDSDLRRMSQEIDMLAQRLEASTARSARAVSGIDKSILGLMGKVDASGKAQLQALERVTRAMGEIESTQSALRNRIDSLEASNRTGNIEGLKALEAALSRLGDTVSAQLHDAQREQEHLRTLFDDKVSQVANRVDDVARSVDHVVSSAVRSNSEGLAGRINQVEDKMSSVERRIEAGLNKISDAAARFESFESKAERAVGDTAWRMERALETNLSRSREMSKQLLDRVDGIEEKHREALNSLSEAVSRITDRLSRAERKADTAVGVLERAVSEIDERTLRNSRQADENAQLQASFQKRLDTFAEDIARPMHALRADMERRIEDVLRSGSTEKAEQLERAIRQLQDQLRVSEARQADAVEAMSTQVDRLSRAVDERLRAVEGRDDSRSIEDVRREISRLADTIDARLGAAESSTRSDIGRLNTAVDDKLQALEKRSAGAIDAVGEQVALVAERLQKRHDEAIQRLSARIAETAAVARPLDSGEIDRIADRLDDRVKESERRSADAISQIGEQVARVADRLQGQHIDALRLLEHRLEESGRTYENRLADVMSELQGRMQDLSDQSANALNPVQNTVTSIARRLEHLEDTRRDAPSRSAEAVGDTPADPTVYVVLDDDPAGALLEPQAAPEPISAFTDTDDPGAPADIAGVEPPPFDRKTDRRDDHLFSEEPRPETEAATRIDDLLDADGEIFSPVASAGEIFADLPADDGREKLSSSYLEEARRAAREGRRFAPLSPRKSVGKGPLIASGMLAVAVAGGAAFTVMRGKQEAQPEDFAKVDPAAPAAPAAPVAASGAPAATDTVLFEANKDTAPAPAAHGGDLFGEKPAPTADADAKKAPASAGAPTLDDAVRSGDPVALHDRALELLYSGEKAKAVAMLKDAAGRGLVMADYRLAKLYEKGEGVPRDIAASRAWTEKAAIGGNVKAMHDLAVFYAEGDAGPQSYAAAVEWFRQASDAGLVDSQYNLAVLYEQGLGLSQDKTEAAYWYEVAGRAGDQDAARRARAILSEMQPTQAEAIRRKARSFAPKTPIPRANGDFGVRPWDVATPDQVMETQRLLQRLGFNPGLPDGKLSVRTSEAIRNFQRDHSLPVTGEASVSLLGQLRAATLGASQ